MESMKSGCWKHSGPRTVYLVTLWSPRLRVMENHSTPEAGRQQSRGPAPTAPASGTVPQRPQLSTALCPGTSEGKARPTPSAWAPLVQ